MGLLSLLGAFTKVKTTQTGDQVAKILAKLDPDAVTESAIIELDDRLRIMTDECAAARREYQKELKQAEQARDLYNRRVAAAENLQAQLDANPSKDVEDALNELLETIESTAEDVEREEQEANDAKEILDAMEESCTELAEQLKALRTNAKKLKTELVRAEQESERAARREEQAKILAGIKKSTSGYTVAMEALEAAANDAKDNASASKHRATLLAPKPEVKNDIIAKAMGEGTAKPATSTKERLAALKKS